MKTLLSITIVILLFTGCEQPEFQTECSTPVTVRDLTNLDGCSWVFELENGNRLVPLRPFFCGTPPLPKEVTEDPLYNFEFVDGKRVFINYEPVKDMADICMAGEIVKITCLSELRYTPEGEH